MPKVRGYTGQFHYKFGSHDITEETLNQSNLSILDTKNVFK